MERVQETALATFGQKDFDPKLYVDLSLKSNLSTTVTAFHKLPRNATGSVLVPDFKEFLHEYFDGVGDDLVYAEPPDFVPEPDGFLPKVKNPQVRAWALEVHALWKNLSRRVSGSVLNRPEFHTLLPLPRPFVIPGSRFTEVYYWDSYWVIRLVFVFVLFFFFQCQFSDVEDIFFFSNVKCFCAAKFFYGCDSMCV